MPIIIIAAVVVLIDQATKYVVQQHMQLGTSIPVVKEIFHLTYILNPGAAFGIMEYKTPFFLFVACVLLAGIFYLIPKMPPECLLLRTGAGLMAGGAIGNVIDRVHTGYVVDFFDFRIWPIFNVADIAIVTGVGLIIYTLLFDPRLKDGKQDGEIPDSGRTSG